MRRRTSIAVITVLGVSLLGTRFAMTGEDRAESVDGLISLEIANWASLEDLQIDVVNRVPIRLHNGSDAPLMIVGDNACCGVDCDFGSKSIPFEIKAGETFEFELTLEYSFPKQREIDFDIYCGLSDQMVVQDFAFSADIKDSDVAGVK